MANVPEALTRFRIELRNHKTLSRCVIVLAVGSAVLSDALIPLFTSKMLSRLADQSATSTLSFPMVAFIGCALAVIALWPLRMYLKRKLEDRVRAGLSDWLDGAIRAATTLQVGGRGAMVGATSKFFAAWANILFATIEQLVPFVVGMLSLIVLMMIYAPFMTGIAITATIAAIMVVRKYGPQLIKTWDDRTHAGHEELAIFDGLFVSYRMQWLVQVLSVVRKHKSAKLTTATQRYLRVMLLWQVNFQALINLLKISAIVGSVLLATSDPGWVGTAFLLVWYSLALSERLMSLASISEAYGASLVEAEGVLRAVSTSSKPALPPGQIRVVTVADLEVRYTVLSDEGQEDEVVVCPQDMVFEAGVNLLRGPSGCGKSTILGAIAGYVPYKGTIRLNDHEVSDFDVRSPMVYGEQGFDKLNMTVEQLFGENPDVALRRQCLSFAAYEHAPLKRLLPQLSGGQRRRVFLAATFYWTLKRDADVLLIDEPTNDLDDEAIDKLLDGIDLIIQQLPDLVLVMTSHEPRMKEIAPNIVELKL